MWETIQQGEERDVFIKEIRKARAERRATASDGIRAQKQDWMVKDAKNAKTALTSKRSGQVSVPQLDQEHSDPQRHSNAVDELVNTRAALINAQLYHNRRDRDMDAAANDFVAALRKLEKCKASKTWHPIDYQDELELYSPKPHQLHALENETTAAFEPLSTAANDVIEASEVVRTLQEKIRLLAEELARL